nr:MAG TPA: hypothetical protein [Caudoviricetes sp.]
MIRYFMTARLGLLHVAMQNRLSFVHIILHPSASDSLESYSTPLKKHPFRCFLCFDSRYTFKNYKSNAYRSYKKIDIPASNSCLARYCLSH